MKSTNGCISIKSVCGDDIHRFRLESGSSLSDLQMLVHGVHGFSEMDGVASFRYMDDEGDLILVTTDRDLNEAFTLVREGKLNCLKLLVDKGAKGSDEQKNEESVLQGPTIEHPIECNECKTFPIPGVRFSCTKCPNYNLCEGCEDKEVHAHHPLTKHRKASAEPVEPMQRAKPISKESTDDKKKTGKTTYRASHRPWRTSCRKPLKAKFLHEVNLQSGTEVLPSMTLVKTWKVANIGNVAWRDIHLVHHHGSLPSVEKAFDVAATAPGHECLVSAVVVTPAAPGRYRAVFRLQDEFGSYFGPKMWCDVVVVDEVSKACAAQRQEELKKYKEAKKAEAASAWQQMRARKKAWREMKQKWNQEWEEEAKKKAWDQQRLHWKQVNMGVKPIKSSELLRLYDM
jgi:hypothetical protein